MADLLEDIRESIGWRTEDLKWAVDEFNLLTEVLNSIEKVEQKMGKSKALKKQRRRAHNKHMAKRNAERGLSTSDMVRKTGVSRTELIDNAKSHPIPADKIRAKTAPGPTKGPDPSQIGGFSTEEIYGNNTSGNLAKVETDGRVPTLAEFGEAKDTARSKKKGLRKHAESLGWKLVDGGNAQTREDWFIAS